MRFSVDTLRFDSLFTTLPSPVLRAWVYNNGDNNLLIESITLEKGTNSEFFFVFDGIDTNEVRNYELLKGDSVLVLVWVHAIRTRQGLLEDAIVFKIGNQTQKLFLKAQIIDAYFIQDSVLCNVTLPTDKPIVIDGFCIVDSGCKVTIPAGARLHFTSRNIDGFLVSGIYVFGSLEVLGTTSMPVTFNGVRFDHDYPKTPGQWFGIWLMPSANNCVLRHAYIRGANIGIGIDSTRNDGSKKLRMEQCLVEHMAFYGVLLQSRNPMNVAANPEVELVNCIIHNCREGAVVLVGSHFTRLINCTLANYSYLFFRRQNPTLGIKTAFAQQGPHYYARLQCINTIVWGSEDNEVGIDADPNFLQYEFQNCLLKHAKPSAIQATNTLFNQDPLFEAPQAYEDSISFRLSANSPAINKGVVLPAVTPLVDFLNQPRDSLPDIGALEY